ncbi:MAG: nucleoside phosphorylase [Candidatus Tectimicrobiota bacterium]
MTPAQFLSPEATARIEPAAFTGYVLRHHRTDPARLGLRQTVLVTLLPALERRVLQQLGAPRAQPTPIQHQALYQPDTVPFALIASPMGAPMAVMLLEQLIALGARSFIYLGFCGALATQYRIGDGFLPTQAIREEGTSYHYLPAHLVPCAAPSIQARLLAQAAQQQLIVRQGPIWTTDAVYRETPQKIQHYQAAGVHAVDMEMAALFAVAQYRGCQLGALLLVSDECYHPTWKPGFGATALRQACQSAASIAIATATELALEAAAEAPTA